MTKQQKEPPKTINNQQNQKKVQPNLQKYQSDSKYQSDQPIQQKKKIIKKFPFLKKQTNQHDDQLKNWKPSKINIKNQQKTKTNLQQKTNNIGLSFLSLLPKPLNSQKDQQNANSLTITKNEGKLFQNKKIKLSQQQLKWDVEDQFINKSKQVFKHEIKQQQFNSQQKLKELDIEGQQYVQKIKWLNEESNQKQNINLLDKISKIWEKSNQQEQDFDSINQNKKKFNSNKSKFNKN